MDAYNICDTAVLTLSSSMDLSPARLVFTMLVYTAAYDDFLRV